MDTPSQINSNIISALQQHLMTTKIETKSIANKGMQAYMASVYLDLVTKKSHAAGAKPFIDFCNEYIGIYSHTKMSESELKITFFDVCQDATVEGVSFSLNPFDKKMVINKLVGIYGVSSSKLLREIFYV